MLKFIKHHMTTIDGVAWYPILALVLFGAFFLAWTIYSFRMSKETVDELSNIPFDNKNNDHE